MEAAPQLRRNRKMGGQTMIDPENCLICRRQLSQMEQSPDVIYQDLNWSVRHSQETNILGYLLLESRRHFLDLSQASLSELESYGPLLSAMTGAIRSVIICERVYTFTLAEMVPHFHVHVIPRTAALPPAFRGRGILSYPTTPPPDESLKAEACKRIRRALRATGLLAMS